MHILIASYSQIPVTKYGGTERIIWWLGRELVRRGHKVTYLVAAGSTCPFARVQLLDNGKSLDEQVPNDVDVVHINFQPGSFNNKPYVATVHDNPGTTVLSQNSVFISADHAARHGSDTFVYNCIDFNDYAKPNLNKARTHFHFLAKAAWRLKNVKGAIKVVSKAHQKLVVLGGTRLNLKMGLRFTPNLNVRFKGMVDDVQKAAVLNTSKGLLFPVLWHEPFGIAIIESLYYGCPVFGTPYGSLPELVPQQFGLLANSVATLAEGLTHADAYDKRQCHQYAADNFNIAAMAQHYINLYERVLNGETLNSKPAQRLEMHQPKFLPWND
jgi:glycosyltransferase involved in cell wall biosynthesis